jgi:hypothetical protein
MSKISIRFYKDHKVRAVWDEENSKWWLPHQARQAHHSATDNTLAINDKED